MRVNPLHDIRPQSRTSARLRFVGVLFLAAAAMVAAPARAKAALLPLRCAEVTFAVALAPGQAANQTMVGWLCARGAIQHHTLQVLVHGGTYDHNYWDFPFQPQNYSYVEAITAAGYATLDLDRVGSGRGSHPAGLTLTTGAYTLHQVIQTLRGGNLLVRGFGFVKGERIVVVGHSLGSLIASIEASTYDDVDGVILSGTSHTVGPGNAVAIANLYPASFDPKFAGLGLPNDYFTTVPGTRGIIFYYLANADPNVIAVDEQLKQTVSLGELLEIASAIPSTSGIRVPTLVAIGDYDFFGCQPPSCTASGWRATELVSYPAAPCVEATIIPDAGHVLNLHRNAQSWFTVARDWSDRRIGASTKQVAPQACP